MCIFFHQLHLLNCINNEVTDKIFRIGRVHRFIGRFINRPMIVWRIMY